MGTELVIGNFVQMLAVWGPISLLFLAVLRLLWRAGDRQPYPNLLAGQRTLQAQVEALTREVRELKQQQGGGSIG